MHDERRSRAAGASEREAVGDTEAPRDSELQLGRQLKERHGTGRFAKQPAAAPCWQSTVIGGCSASPACYMYMCVRTLSLK